MQILKMLLLNEAPSTMPKHIEFLFLSVSCRLIFSSDFFSFLWGKSTLANFLLGQEHDITGPEPGLTRDTVHGRL